MEENIEIFDETLNNLEIADENFDTLEISEEKTDNIDVELESVDDLELELVDYEEITIEEQGQIIVDNDKNYLHKQNIPSDEWVINHNLGKYPAVSIIDSAKNEVIGEIIYHNENSITVSFMSEFSGIATLN